MTTQRDVIGRYDFSNNDRMCVCGHPLAHHFAADEERGGPRACAVGQNEPGDLCSCVGFKPARKSKKTFRDV